MIQNYSTVQYYRKYVFAPKEVQKCKNNFLGFHFFNLQRNTLKNYWNICMLPIRAQIYSEHLFNGQS